MDTTMPLVFSGNANTKLTSDICQEMMGGLEVIARPTPLKSTHFSDGEIFVELGANVRGRDCFVVQPTCATTIYEWEPDGPNPRNGRTKVTHRSANDNLMELCIISDALRRASAGSIVAVMPYFGYARQDRKVKPRTPISAKLVADLLVAAGVTRVLAVDLHAAQIQGFFNIPFDHLYARPVFRDVLKDAGLSGDKVVVVSPDAGGVERARGYAAELGASLAIIDKRREQANVCEVMNVIGDVAGMTAVIVDDMIDTAGTLVNAAEALIKRGAKEVHAVATHGVLSGPALTRIRESSLTRVWVTDSIPNQQRVAFGSPDDGRITFVSLAPLLAEAIRRIHSNDSLSSLFA